nr:zinc finger C2H2 type [Hymenolepis microstoma]
MTRYKDIFDTIVHATSIDCQNRLLAFTKVRNIISHDASAARTASRQIINRVRNTALENYKMGLWGLDLLQMCTLYGGENFALFLNNQEQLNELLHFFLIPEKSKAVSTQVQMKINSLLKTWAIAYKDVFSTNNFNYAYDRLKRINMSTNMNDLRNSHWFPDKDVFGNPIEDITYNLQDVFIEISNENKLLYAELQSFFKMASDEKNKGLKIDEDVQKCFKDAQQRTGEIKHMVSNSQAFWTDLFEHLANKPSNYKEVDSNVQKVFESMDKAINFCEIALQLEEEVVKEVNQDIGGYPNEIPENQFQTGVKISDSKMNPMQKGAHIPPRTNTTTKSIFKQNIQMPVPNVSVPSIQSKKLSENGSGHIPPWHNSQNGLIRTNNLKSRQNDGVAKLNGTSNEKTMVAVETQTEVKEEPKPQIHRLQARSINVQCVDCKAMFSNLDKLLSHLCLPPSWKKSEIKQPVKLNIIPSEQTEQQKLPPPTVPEVAEPLKENVEDSFVCEVCKLEFEEMGGLESHRLTPRHLFSVRRSSAGSANLKNDVQVDTKKLRMKPPTKQPEMPTFLPRKPFSENELNFGKRELPDNFNIPFMETCRNEVKEEVTSTDFDSIVNVNLSRLIEEEAIHYQEPPLVPEKMRTWKRSNHNEASEIENVDQHQSSQEEKKYVDSNDSRFGDSMENSGANPYMEIVQPLPELPVKSSLPSGISEDTLPREMRELLHANNITIRREFLFCNDCYIYLHFDEANKHINSKDHKTAVREVIQERPPSSVSSNSEAEIYPVEALNTETGDNTGKFSQMPKLPQFAQVQPIVKDGKYIAVFVPASQLAESGTLAGPISTQFVSVSDQSQPLVGDATKEANNGF